MAGPNFWLIMAGPNFWLGQFFPLFGCAKFWPSHNARPNLSPLPCPFLFPFFYHTVFYRDRDRYRTVFQSNGQKREAYRTVRFLAFDCEPYRTKIGAVPFALRNGCDRGKKRYGHGTATNSDALLYYSFYRKTLQFGALRNQV